MTDLLGSMIEDTKRRRARDAATFNELDEDLCMICHAYGPDKRGFFLDCGYAVYEVVPEALDIRDAGLERGSGYFLRLCKTCRSQILEVMGEWAKLRRLERSQPKDHDGCPEWDEESDRNIPVRVNGATIMMNKEEYEYYRARKR